MHKFANHGYGLSIRLEMSGSNSAVESDSRVEFEIICVLSRRYEGFVDGFHFEGYWSTSNVLDRSGSVSLVWEEP